jgi:hypothetical protein
MCQKSPDDTCVRTSERVRLLWLRAGTVEGPPIGDSVRGGAVDAVRKNGMACASCTSSLPGQHEWQTWRRDLHDLAPRVFKASPGAAANK